MSFNTRVTLVEKLKSGQDQEAWFDFYRHYSPYISAVIRNLDINESDIDDLVQKVMMLSWEKIPEFNYDKERGLFRSWLIRIARNVVMNFLKSSARYSARLKHFSEDQITLFDDKDSSIDREWRVHISKLAWESIKDNYDEKVQNAFELISTGMSNKDIGEKLDIKANTIAVYKKRITEALRTEIRRLDNYLS